MKLFTLFLRTPLVMVLFFSAAATFASPSFHVNPIVGLSPDFIRGADVSTLAAMEAAGALYRDDQDRPADLLDILKAHGVNWIRLRLWNDPTNPADVMEGNRLLSRKGDPRGGGNNDLATTVALAKRVKTAGLHFLLDFHYSDFWADPGNQRIPKAWIGLNKEALAKAIYSFTKQSLATLKEAGAEPDMVQIGNEINNGMLWPLGKIGSDDPQKGVGGFNSLALFLRQASQAVRDTDPAIKIAIHLANGGDQGLYRWFFDAITKRGVDFDVIGFSFYPYWHGKVEDLQSNLNAAYRQFHKPVVVLETAYARTEEDADGYSNAFGKGMDLTGGYRATVQGQATELRDVMAAVATVPDHQGLGVFYWEPAWYYVKNVGWRTGSGNNWDNQTLFDFRGHPEPSLSTFRLVGEPGLTIVPQPVAAVSPTIDAALDQPVWALPSTVLCAFSDDAYRPSAVSWDVLDRASMTKPETLFLHGTVVGTNLAVKAQLRIAATSNLLSDPSFESGQLGSWTIEGTKGVVLVENNPGNAHSGSYTLKYWKDSAFQFKARRTIHHLAAGTYQVSLWAMGGGGESSIFLSAWAENKPIKQAKMRNTGWLKWTKYTVKDLVVTNGDLNLEISVNGNNGNWGNFDDVAVRREQEHP